MKETIIEMVEMVRDLNDQFEIQTEGSCASHRPFRLVVDGSDGAIQWFSYPIWSSDEDERQYRIGMEDMSLRDYVIQEVNEMLKEFGQIKLK